MYMPENISERCNVLRKPFTPSPVLNVPVVGVVSTYHVFVVVIVLSRLMSFTCFASYDSPL